MPSLWKLSAGAFWGNWGLRVPWNRLSLALKKRAPL